jgi:hypothetical protein
VFEAHRGVPPIQHDCGIRQRNALNNIRSKSNRNRALCNAGRGGRIKARRIKKGQRDAPCRLMDFICQARRWTSCSKPTASSRLSGGRGETPPEACAASRKTARRAALARQAVIVLGELQELLGDDGINWMRNVFTDGWGSYCLVGGLRRIRAIRGSGDNAGVYLRRAIAKVSLGEAIIHFNDSRESFAEIRRVIFLARELAHEVANGRT